MNVKHIRSGKGFGYECDDGKLCMIQCFECGKENLEVLLGICSWCGFDANKKEKV